MVDFVNWIGPLFFVTVLTAIYGSRQRFLAYGKESYTRVVSGLTTLAFVSLTNLLAVQGVFQGVPFLSEKFFVELVVTIGSIAGSLLLALGVSHWLSHRQTERARTERLHNRHQILTQTEQQAHIESRIDVVMESVLNRFLTIPGLTFGCACKLRSRDGEVLPIASSDPEKIAPALLAGLKIPRELWTRRSGNRAQAVSGCFQLLRSELPSPQYVYAVVVGGRPAGFFMLWSKDKSVLDSDDELTIRLAIDVIATKLEKDQLTRRLRWQDEVQNWIRRIVLDVELAPAAQEAVAAALKGISRRVSSDVLALSLVDSRTGRLDRWTMGYPGRTLFETGLRMPDLDEGLGLTFHAGEEGYWPDLQESERPAPWVMLIPDGTRSMLALPVIEGGRVVGALVLLSSQPTAFSSQQIQELRQLDTLLTQVAQKYRTESRVERSTAHLEQTARLLRSITDNDNPGAPYSEAAGLLAKELRVDLVRVSTVERDESFLRSRSMKSLHGLRSAVPSDGRMILSLMPLHSESLLTGQHVILNNAQRTVFDGEISQAFFDGCEGAVLMPFGNLRRSTGIISLGWRDHSAVVREDSDEWRLLEMIAAELGLVQFQSLGSIPHLLEEAPDENVYRTEGNVKSSLSGILGSVEVLKQRSGDTASLEHYLDIIDRSAKRLGQELVSR